MFPPNRWKWTVSILRCPKCPVIGRAKKQWSTAFYRIIVDDEPPFTAKRAIFLKDNIIHLILLMVGIILFVESYIVAKKKGKFARGPDGSIENAPLVPEPKL